MEIDLTYADVSADEAHRLWQAVQWPKAYPEAYRTNLAGDTEPWVASLLAGLVRATGAKRVLETGGYQGKTSLWLACALEALGEGHLTVCEIDADRAQKIHHALESVGFRHATFGVRAEDVMAVIADHPDGSLDFAFVDDDHSAEHVHAETTLLIPKMRPGGLILFHDVYGSCDLQRVARDFGGACLKLPRLGPAGGLGLLQC